jgi:hypothetical protein
MLWITITLIEEKLRARLFFEASAFQRTRRLQAYDSQRGVLEESLSIMSLGIRVKKIRLGDDVPSRCGRCKGERTHQVVALNPNGVPAIVICRTCGSRHNYRDAQGSARRTSDSKRTDAKQQKRAAIPSKPPRIYSPREIYDEGDWIDHPKFGQGEITAIRDGKIEVRFGKEKRLFLHAG